MDKRICKNLVTLLAAGSLAACASSNGTPSVSADAATAQQVVDLQAELEQRERALSDERNRVESLNQQLSRSLESGSRTSDITGVEGAELLPPDAKPGHCFARSYVAPTFRTETEKVLKTASSSRIQTVPAKFEPVEERVLAEEASTRLEVVPATYKIVEERLLVTPASTRLEAVAAVYEWEEERVLVKPATTMWKKGTGPINKVDEATGEIMCLVEVPAEYKTVRRRVLVTPATTRTIEIPAEYKTVTRRVVDRPATTRTVEIPAKYQTVKKRRLVSPASSQQIAIPAEYQTVTHRVQESPGRMAWVPVLCETNATPAVVAQIQRALQSKGHSPGPIDGIIGRETLAAVRSYQTEKRLPSGGLNFETIEALGVKVGR